MVTSFSNLLADYTKYNDLNNNYQKNLLDLQTKTMTGLKTRINSVLDLVSNNQTGLIAGLNCTFMKRAVDNMVDSMCVDFVPSFYQLMILILLTAGFSWLMSIALIRNGLMVHRKFKEKNGTEYAYADPNAHQNERIN